jgi:hypothetical protein
VGEERGQLGEDASNWTAAPPTYHERSTGNGSESGREPLVGLGALELAQPPLAPDALGNALNARLRSLGGGALGVAPCQRDPHQACLLLADRRRPPFREFGLGSAP